MPIARCSQQDEHSLEEFYQEVSANKAYDPTGVGSDMLQVIDLINKLFKKTKIWGLTSHARLIIQSIDDSASDWYVTIGGIGQCHFHIEYLMPVYKQPWDNAQVKGEVWSLAEAEKYLLIAMRESEGWVNNEELSALLKERAL